MQTARFSEHRMFEQMGLPGWWRLSAQPDAAAQALLEALDSLGSTEAAA